MRLPQGGGVPGGVDQMFSTLAFNSIRSVMWAPRSVIKKQNTIFIQPPKTTYPDPWIIPFGYWMTQRVMRRLKQLPINHGLDTLLQRLDPSGSENCIIHKYRVLLLGVVGDRYCYFDL